MEKLMFFSNEWRFMGGEENALRDNISMFWKMYQNINFKAFYFNVNVFVNYNKWLN